MPFRAADGYQLLGVIEDLFGQLSAGANADKVRVGDLSLMGFRQRTGDVLNAGVPGSGLQDFDGRWVDAFQKELDLALIEKKSCSSA